MIYPAAFPAALRPGLEHCAEIAQRPWPHELRELAEDERAGRVPAALPVRPEDSAADRALLLTGWRLWDLSLDTPPPPRGSLSAFAWAALLELASAAAITQRDCQFDEPLEAQDLPGLLALSSVLDDVDAEVRDQFRPPHGESLPERVRANLVALDRAQDLTPRARWGERPTEMLLRLLAAYFTPESPEHLALERHVRHLLALAEVADVGGAVLDVLARPTWE